MNSINWSKRSEVPCQNRRCKAYSPYIIDEALKPNIIKKAHMNSDTYEGSTQEALVYQSLQEQHRDELENIVRLLASITNISPERVKPHMDTLLRQLVNQPEEPPFSETATASEWVTAFREWAASHHHDVPPLSDYAVSRESMYEDERL